jgi:LmbE family N-acetylglucosaminyl deacetylase
MKEKLKSVLLGFFSFCARDLPVSADWDPVLVIAPHPDDESLGAGAVIARLRAQGKRVRIVIVTDGSASDQSGKITPAALAATRRIETEVAAAALGVPKTEIAFLAFPDGRAETQVAAIDAALEREIEALMPRAIFGPYGADKHPDHRTTAAALDRLCKAGKVNCRVYEYPIWFWSSHALRHLIWPFSLLRLRRVRADEFLAAKKAAIMAHRSQFEAPAGATDRFAFPAGFVAFFLTPYELFFEKTHAGH